MMSGRDIDFVIDLESSSNSASENGYTVREGKNLSYKDWSGLTVCGRSIREEPMRFENKMHNDAGIWLETLDALSALVDEKVENVVRAEKPKKKGCTKPPKPPRPPRPVSLDLADQKLIREISELAMLKKARGDRMKTLKKIKNGKSASFSAGNTFALVVTLIFCIVIFWQGVFPKGRSSSAFLGSPQSSIGATTNSNSSSNIFSFQFYDNASTNTESS